MKNQGDRLKSLIADNRLSNKGLAEQLNVKANYISMLITGKKPISEKLAYNITKVIPDLNTEWLLNGDGSMYKDKYNINIEFPIESAKKFKNISDDEFALYFLKNKERLLRNEIINLIYDKESTSRAMDILKKDIIKAISKK